MVKTFFSFAVVLIMSCGCSNSQVMDSLTYTLVRYYADTSNVNPFDTTIGNCLLGDFLFKAFPKEFHYKNVGKTLHTYIVNGKFTIISSRDKKVKLEYYNESGAYIKMKHREDRLKIPVLKLKNAKLNIPSGITLGMTKEEFLNIRKVRTLYIKNGSKETFYYCWRRSWSSCLDDQHPFVMYCLPFFAEYHFKNNVLIEVGFGYSRYLPSW